MPVDFGVSSTISAGGYLQLDSKHLNWFPSFSCKQCWSTSLPWTRLGIRAQKHHLKQRKQKQGNIACNAETIELYHFLLPALDVRWSLGKGHYLDEEGGLRQILLQHTKREELLCLELEDKSFMGMNFRKATVQIWHVPGNDGEQVPSQLPTSFINSDSRLISVVRRPHCVLSLDQL